MNSRRREWIYTICRYVAAKGQAGVTCAVVGLRRRSSQNKRIYENGTLLIVDHISPYLHAGSDVFVVSSRDPLNDLPPLAFGSMPNDNGGLILSSEDREVLLKDAPTAARWVRRFMGAKEFLSGIERYCIWISDSDVGGALKIPAIAERVSRVADFRRRSKRGATRDLSAVPHRFGEVRHKDTNAILVPGVSSERREYIPMGFVGPDTVISNLANAIYDADPWVFGLIQSRMHMVWTRTVAGRLESRIRYSAVLVYNTFPVPDLSADDKAALTKAANRILGTRELFSEQTLAELYDPKKMPPPLREAHVALDKVVDDLYDPSGFDSDEQRLELLFDMYAKLTSAQTLEAAGA